MSVTFRLRPEAKFADGSPITADDVVFSFDILKEKGTRLRVQLARRRQGRSARSAHRALHLHGHADAATCRWPLPACRCSPRPITPRTSSSRPRSSRRWARAPTRSPTSGRAPTSATSAATTIGPRTFRSTAAATISTRSAIEYYPRSHGGARSAQGRRPSTCARSSPSRDWATGYDIAAVKEGRLIKLTLPDENPSGAQGFFLNTRRPKFADLRVRKALDLRVRLRVDQQEHVLWPLQRTDSFFENSDMKARASRARPSWRCSSRSATKLPPGGVRGALRPAGLRRHGARIASCCARPPGCSTRPAGRSRTASASTPTARRSRSSS